MNRLIDSLPADSLSKYLMERTGLGLKLSPGNSVQIFHSEWQESSHLSTQCCFPGIILAGIGNWECSWISNPHTPTCDEGIFTT